MALACSFLGFRLEVRAEPAPWSGPAPAIVLVHADALAGLSAAAWQEAPGGRDVPIAVVEIAPEGEAAALEAHLGFTVAAGPSGPDAGLWVSASDASQTGFELRGIRFDLGSSPGGTLMLPASHSAQLLAIAGGDEQGGQPVLIRASHHGSARYALARLGSGKPDAGPRRAALGEILPWFLLLRDAGKDRCWHAPAVLANLTIDDPRLVEPYGRLSFPGLLAEMQRVPFHTTIGFIPWNHDRNDPAIVALFRAHPEQFSLAVHGNNHEGYEFFRYEAKPGDTQRSAPYEKQVFNIKQGLARIRAFERSTGLAVDRVMVFPQAISPAPTLDVLRQHGFLATSNFSNVPLDATLPDDPALALHSALTHWHDLPAVRRDYPHEYSDEAIAVDLFLGNPVLFMAHQDDFSDGIDAFTRHAARVNQRQPAVRWTGLGEIARHLHRVRWLDATTCDVRMVTCQAQLANPRPNAARFTVLLPRAEIRPGTRVSVAGKDQAWSRESGGVRFELTLPAGAAALVEVQEPLAPEEPVALGRSGFRKRYLRLVADFRDLVISRSQVGRTLTEKYYRKLRRPALKTGRGRRRVALLWESDQGTPRLRSALLADLPPHLR